MKPLYALIPGFLLLTGMAGCKKDNITGNNTPTGPDTYLNYSNDSLINNGANFYVIADVEGVSGQAKMYVESNYYTVSDVSLYQCFGGGYSTYEVDMPRSSGGTGWVTDMHFSFDSGMVYDGGETARTGSFQYKNGVGGNFSNKIGVWVRTDNNMAYQQLVVDPGNSFVITSFFNGSGGYMKGTFSVKLQDPSGAILTLKNGVFKIRI